MALSTEIPFTSTFIIFYSSCLKEKYTIITILPNWPKKKPVHNYQIVLYSWNAFNFVENNVLLIRKGRSGTMWPIFPHPYIAVKFMKLQKTTQN